MIGSSYSEVEIEKFLQEVLCSPLALSIYKQLVMDGGNTALGISESLKSKGMKASKTRVYEEISTLLKLGLIKRVSNRPPVYTTVTSKDNLEQIAMQFFMESREDLMRRWAATYPFLPDNMKTTDLKTTKLAGGPMVNFNPYPVVDIFNTETEGLRRYMLRVFESNSISVSNMVVDTCFATDNFRRVFEFDNFESFLAQIKTNYDRFGPINTRIMSTHVTDDMMQMKQLTKLTSFYKKYFSLINYEIREPGSTLSSFILGDKNVLYPVGIGGINKRTYFIIEIRDPQIVKIAHNSFEDAWKKAKPILKIENGEIIYQ